MKHFKENITVTQLLDKVLQMLINSLNKILNWIF